MEASLSLCVDVFSGAERLRLAKVRGRWSPAGKAAGGAAIGARVSRKRCAEHVVSEQPNDFVCSGNSICRQVRFSS